LDALWSIEQAQWIARKTYGKGSLTYRQGQSRDWQNHFTEDHRRAFKDVAGDILIGLGYEKVILGRFLDKILTPANLWRQGVRLMRGAQEMAYHIRQGARTYVSKHPLLFYSLHGFLCSQSNVRLVNRKTQLVIEGYPRSGNTFAVVAFQQAQRESIRIAHHLHAPAQVIRAAQLQIPTIVLVREPAETILSQMVRKPRISAPLALKSYITFYETVAAYRNAYVVGNFREVTHEYGLIIQRVNTKFGTDFSPFRHTDANLKEVFATVEHLNRVHDRGLENRVSRPSATKDRLKYEVKSMLETKEATSLLASAEAIYHDFASQAKI
jgi:hypothetical protein